MARSYSTLGRFVDAFAEELGRSAAKATAYGLVAVVVFLLSHLDC